MGVASRDSTGFVLMEEGLISGEAGTSGFLSISDSDPSVPAEVGEGLFLAFPIGHI